MGRSRSVVWLCSSAGMVVGGYVPVLWGAGSFSGISLLFSLFGAIGGIWVGVRLSDV